MTKQLVGFALLLFLLGSGSSFARTNPTQAEAEEKASEGFRKRATAFYENGVLRETYTQAGLQAYIEKAKKVRGEVFKDLVNGGFPQEMAASATNVVVLNAPIIRDPCYPYPGDKIVSGELDENLAAKVNQPKKRESKKEAAAKGDEAGAEALVKNYICPKGKDVIAGLGLLDPKDFSKEPESPSKAKPSEEPKTPPPQEKGEAEAKPPVQTADTNKTPSPSNDTSVRDTDKKTPPPAVAQGPKPSSNTPDEANGSANTEKPSFGPSSPAGPETAWYFRESSQNGAAHSGPGFVPLEAPTLAAQNSPKAPEKAPAATPSPELAARNFSAVKEALDEKVSIGELDATAATTVLASLKPLLKTEPDLARALSSVHDNLKATLSGRPVTETQSAIDRTTLPSESARSTASLPVALKPNAQPTPGTLPPTSSAPGAAPLFVLASSDRAASQVNEGIAKEIASKLAASNALVPADNKTKKPEVPQGVSTLLKSAISLNDKPSSSTPPFLFSESKTKTDLAPRVGSAAAGPGTSIKQVLSKIASLFPLSSMNDSEKPRAISSTSDKLLSNGDTNLEEKLRLAADPIENASEDETFSGDFVSYGIGAFTAAFLVGFALWRMRRQPKKAKT